MLIMTIELFDYRAAYINFFPTTTIIFSKFELLTLSLSFGLLRNMTTNYKLGKQSSCKTKQAHSSIENSMFKLFL